jgi:fatty acid desaturase
MMGRSKTKAAGGHAAETEDDVTTIHDLIERTPASRSTYTRASLFYLAFMAAWIYGFANSQRDLPGIAVMALLILAVIVHLGIGIAIGRQEAVALAFFPPALALIGPGLDSALWMPLFMLMLFPGAPLIFAGHFVRRTIEEPKVEEWF